MSTSTTASARFTGIAPGLPVPDVRRAAEFYRDHLVFVIEDHADHFAWLDRDGLKLMLWRGQSRGSMSQRDANPGISDVGIWVDDVDLAHAEFTRNRLEVVEQPEDMPYGLRHAMYRDLNDYIILTSGPVRGDAG